VGFSVARESVRCYTGQMRSFLASLLLLGTACAEGGGRGDRVPVDLGPGPADASPGTDAIAPLPDLSPGVDLGVDLGVDPVDLGPPIGCTSTADCDNGVACDGMELCSAGTCMPGTPVACDDGVACTMDQCAEPGGVCTFTPNDSLCPSGQTCDSVDGCEAGAPSCTESPCKLVSPQCGCGAGQACTMDPDGNRSCATAGSSSTGSACSAIADCQGGNTCIGLNSTVGGCHRFCDTDSDCGGQPGALCILGLEDSTGASLTETVCTLGCEPASQTGCPAGSWCFLGQESTGAMRDLSHCSGDPLGPGTQGAFCATQDDCAPGYLCLDPGTGSNECLHLCRNPSTISPTFNADCPSSFYDCFALDPVTALGATTYGVCSF